VDTHLEKFEQAVAVLMLAMGLLMMREGFSYFSRSEAGGRLPGESLAIVLAGPDGIEKTAQAEFLRRRYGLRTVSAGDLPRDAARGRIKRFLLQDCAARPREAHCLAALARQRDLPTPVFIEVADRRLQSPAYSAWDVDLIQSYYPDADVWTLDGTRPTETTSETLQRLLDRPAGK
jgi:hypothetical protein